MKTLVQLKAEDVRSPLDTWMIGRRHKIQSQVGGILLPNKFIQGTTGMISEHRLVDIVQVPEGVTEVLPGSTYVIHELDQQWCELPADRQTCKVPLECFWAEYKETGIKLMPGVIMIKVEEVDENMGGLILTDCYREVHKDKGTVLLSTIEEIKKGDNIVFTPFKGGGMEFNYLGMVFLFLRAKDVHLIFDDK